MFNQAHFTDHTRKAAVLGLNQECWDWEEPCMASQGPRLIYFTPSQCTWFFLALFNLVNWMADGEHAQSDREAPQSSWGGSVGSMSQASPWKASLPVAVQAPTC